MRVAAVQMNSTVDKVANLEEAERLIRSAAKDSAELIVLPEKWNALGTGEQTAAAAERLDGQSLTLVSQLAEELAVEIVAGSIVELAEEGQRHFNTSVHFDASGNRKAVYRKIHLFDVEVAGVSYRESEYETAGEEIVATQLDSGVKLGLSICYDLRFPELYRILALNGALVFSLPAAFTLATTRDHWHVLTRARAVENQAFLIAANQIGSHGPNLRSGGRSLIVDPWGVVLAQAPDTSCHIVADLDLAHQVEIRSRLPVFGSRKPKSYILPD